jgi:hypothetical protein
MRVQLCRGKAFVAEQLLHHAQIRSAIKEMRRETVAKRAKASRSESRTHQ